MRFKKSGDPALPKEAYLRLLEDACRAAAKIEVLLETFEPLAKEAFAQVRDGGVINAAVGMALVDLVIDLESMKDGQLALASSYADSAHNVRRGAPRKVRLGRLSDLLPARKGAPRKHSDEDYVAIFNRIEERRAQLSKGPQRRVTIKAAIEHVLAEDARRLGRSELRYIDEREKALKAMYHRGKALRN